MTYGGSLTTWLAAIPGLEDIEELAEQLDPRELHPCRSCDAAGCEECDGTGIGIDLGGEG